MVLVAATAASAARARRRWRRTRDDAKARGDATASDVCLYSPATIERARSALPRLASTWRGTVSVAVLADLRTPVDALDLSALASELEGDSSRVVVTMVEALPEYENRFPVNFLRNLAREKCVAELGATYVLAHDVDFEVFVAPERGRVFERRAKRFGGAERRKGTARAGRAGVSTSCGVVAASEREERCDSERAAGAKTNKVSPQRRQRRRRVHRRRRGQYRNQGRCATTESDVSVRDAR